MGSGAYCMASLILEAQQRAVDGLCRRESESYNASNHAQPRFGCGLRLRLRLEAYLVAINSKPCVRRPPESPALVPAMLLDQGCIAVRNPGLGNTALDCHRIQPHLHALLSEYPHYQQLAGGLGVEPKKRRRLALWSVACEIRSAPRPGTSSSQAPLPPRPVRVSDAGGRSSGKLH